MTLREIMLAWRGKCDFHWTQTAETIAAILNIRPRGKNDRRNFVGSDFYKPENAKAPKRSRCTSGTPLTIGLLRSLKQSMFGGGNNACRNEV